MEIPISNYEVSTLDKIIHTHTFGEYHDLELALYDLVAKDKARLVAEGAATDHDFSTFQSRTAANILRFLEHNEFVGIREGGVHFLTQRGEQLRRQGTLEKYLEWEKVREVTLLSDLHTIEQKGYLEKDQVEVKKEIKKIDEDIKRHPLNKNMPYYILILIIIGIVIWYSRSHGNH